MTFDDDIPNRLVLGLRYYQHQHSSSKIDAQIQTTTQTREEAVSQQLPTFETRIRFTPSINVDVSLLRSSLEKTESYNDNESVQKINVFKISTLPAIHSSSDTDVNMNDLPIIQKISPISLRLDSKNVHERYLDDIGHPQTYEGRYNLILRYDITRDKLKGTEKIIKLIEIYNDFKRECGGKSRMLTTAAQSFYYQTVLPFMNCFHSHYRDDKSAFLINFGNNFKCTAFKKKYCDGKGVKCKMNKY